MKKESKEEAKLRILARIERDRGPAASVFAELLFEQLEVKRARDSIADWASYWKIPAHLTNLFVGG